METLTQSHLSYEELLATNALLASGIQSLSVEKNVLEAEKESLNQKVIQLQVSLQETKSHLDWFKRQVFGKKSEKHYEQEVDVHQISLFDFTGEPAVKAEIETREVAAHTRRVRGKTQELGDNTDSGIRFDEGVEIVTEDIFPEEVNGLPEGAYEIVGSEISDRLASRVSKTFVVRRIFHKVKLKRAVTPSESSPSESSGANGLPKILKAKVPKQVLNRSYMSTSFLVDMVLDKVLYSLPLNRQHQRLKREGFHLSRNVLISNFIATCEVLSRVVSAQRCSILAGRTIAIDETPMRVGLDAANHKMHKGYVWPIYGDLNEIVYNYNKSRSAAVLKDLVGSEFKGVLLSDGYSAYKRYVEGLKSANLANHVTHASCWVHARRKFVELEHSHPEVYKQAIGRIKKIYEIEQSVSGKKAHEVLEARVSQSVEVVEGYFTWLRSFAGSAELGSFSKLRKAIAYSLEREDSLKVFLRNPEVSPDTNHLEREIRPITIGRKNWLFCWGELGAQSLCDAQSLIRTCLLHQVNPRTYLIDILQRLSTDLEKEEDVSDLIPRIWKLTYGEDPRPCPSEEVIRYNSSMPFRKQDL